MSNWIWVPALAVGIVLMVIVLMFLPAPAEGNSNFVTLPSGLKYEDLKVGDGREAKTGDRVRVYYVGRLKDGKEFDSCQAGKEPFTFDIGKHGVIEGWEEGVPGMKVGGKRKLIIPPALAYGSAGSPPKIPANAELTFEIELVRVNN